MDEEKETMQELTERTESSATEQPKTFTQDEVNKIVQKRLTEERTRRSEANEKAADLEARERKLTEDQNRFTAKREFERLNYSEDVQVLAYDYIDFSDNKRFADSMAKVQRLISAIEHSSSAGSRTGMRHGGVPDKYTDAIREGMKQKGY